MSMFTCIACRVVFADSSTQRAHYKTDWHRYNLKRKVADLPSVSADTFKQKVLTVQQSQGDVGDTKQSLGCMACGKHFSSQNAMQNHLNSKKHKEIEAKRNKTKEKEENKPKSKQPMKTENKVVAEATDTAKGDEDMEDIETDSDMESVSSFGAEEGLPLGTCLFCSHDDGALEDSLRHMTTAHSFFLPDAEYISDLEGLIGYLGQKVGAGFVCLWCNQRGRSFHSVGAVQKHMLDKGHCKILHDGDVVLEYADFYDYRSSYPDHDETSGAVEGQTEDMEVEVTTDPLDADGYEMVLPSGAVIGHRDLQRYYRQNLNPRTSERGRSLLPRMLAQYKALGWTGAKGPVAERRCKDLAAVQRWKNRSYMHLGVKANKFQPHYRAQIMM